jgi:hypothetical protein
VPETSTWKDLARGRTGGRKNCHVATTARGQDERLQRRWCRNMHHPSSASPRSKRLNSVVLQLFSLTYCLHSTRTLSIWTPAARSGAIRHYAVRSSCHRTPNLSTSRSRPRTLLGANQPGHRRGGTHRQFRHQDMPFQHLIHDAEQSEGHGSLHADKLQPLDLLSY